MYITLANLIIGFAIMTCAGIAIGVIGEYCASALHHRHKSGH